MENLQITTLKKMQSIELEAGFPNGELYNELEDKINSIEINADKQRRFNNPINSKGLEFSDKSNKIHY